MKDFLDKTTATLRSLPVIGTMFDTHPRIISIRFSGIIADSTTRRGGISYARYARLLDKAFNKHDIKAVALVINSPGGTPAQTSLLANHIRRLAEEKELPVYAFVEDIAASGGYWLACAADEIYAQSTSIVGSIGVISAGFGFEDFIKKHDIHRRIHSSGKEKSFLDPFTPESKSNLERLRIIQKDIHESFKEWVRQRRADKLNHNDKSLFEGGFWTAGAAYNLGLIDGVDDINGFARMKWGHDIKIVDLSPDHKLIPSFLPWGAKAADRRSELAEDILHTLETRSDWSRYGL